jgi:hypothetical protein
MYSAEDGGTKDRHRFHTKALKWTGLDERCGPYSIISLLTFPRTLRLKVELGMKNLRLDEVTNIPVIFTASFGRLLGPVGTFSIFRSVSMPSMTLPNTTCFPSRKSHGSVVIKNCKPSSGRRGQIGTIRDAPGSRSCWGRNWPTVLRVRRTPRVTSMTRYPPSREALDLYASPGNSRPGQ